MASVSESIEVDVPVSVAYNQWTQFEEFPSFMEGVESVRQLDDTHLHWAAEIGGKRHEWDAEITHQEPGPANRVAGEGRQVQLRQRHVRACRKRSDANQRRDDV